MKGIYGLFREKKVFGYCSARDYSTTVLARLYRLSFAFIVYMCTTEHPKTVLYPPNRNAQWRFAGGPIRARDSMLTGSCRLSHNETDDAVKLKRKVIRKGSVLCDIGHFFIKPPCSKRHYTEVDKRCKSTLKGKIGEAHGTRRQSAPNVNMYNCMILNSRFL